METLLAGAALYYIFSKNSSHADNTAEPEFDVGQFKNPDSYDMETRKIIDLITIQDNINPVGSQKFKVHRFPGDIDIFEPVRICCSIDDATEKIVEQIKEIAQGIKAEPTFFLGDFKAGLDSRYELKGSYQNGLAQLLSQKLITVDEFEDGMALLRNRDKEGIDIMLREHRVVRWTLDELIAGKKMLPQGIKLQLKDALRHNTVVKLDLWAPINNNYTEITNFFLLMYLDSDGTEHVINVELADRVKSLIGDIKKYSDESHRKSLKVAKRMWALAQFIDDKKTMKKLYPLFYSDAAMLSQINSEIETLSMMFTRLKKPFLPLNTLIHQIDRFKSRMGGLFIKLPEKHIFKLINLITKMYREQKDAVDTEIIVDILEQISHELNTVIEQNVSAYMNKNGLLDPSYYDYLL